MRKKIRKILAWHKATAVIVVAMAALNIVLLVMVQNFPKVLRDARSEAVNAYIERHMSAASDTFPNIDVLKIHEDVNTERRKAGLIELNYDSQLEKSACAKAKDMVTRNYWSHDTPEGSTPWIFLQREGIQYLKAGENLAYGFKDEHSVVDGWMKSPSHKANVLGDFVREGICQYKAVEYQGSNKQVVIVQHLDK
jgi:uncharacterized protein YkwD